MGLAKTQNMRSRQNLFLAILCAVATSACGFEAPRTSTVKTPYWASLRYNETNMRVGPSREYPVEWVYQRKGLPVKVLRTRDEWRLVTDVEGTKGWISRSQLSPARSVVVTGETEVDLREAPQEGGVPLWQAQPGVIGALVSCESNWCNIDIAGRSGWVSAERLWGDEELNPAS